MAFAKEENGFHGSVPEFGAIFMSNIATKRECFKKKVLGLPMSQANFVKEVKSGMVLFLFEYEKRELFGVYRASSDGGINIVSHAFSSSGVNYPAQVRFTPIWICRPLSEPEFRGAISANYYSAKKFNFGLSQNQVHSLLMLFSTRKLRTNLPPRQFTRVNMGKVVENSSVVDDESPALRNGFLKENSIESSPVNPYSKNFFHKDNRTNSDSHSNVDMINNEYGVSFSDGKYFSNTYTNSPTRRRAYDDSRISFDDVAHIRPNDHPLVKDKRLADGSKFEIDDTVDDCKDLPSIMHSNGLVGPAHCSRKTDDAMFTDRERIIDKFNSGLGVTRLTEGKEKLSNNCTSAFASHGEWSLLKDGFEELPNMDNTYSPTVPGNKRSGCGTMVENPSIQYGFIHDSSESKHPKNYAAISEITYSHFVSTSSDKDEVYGDTRSPVDPNGRGRGRDTFVGPGFPEKRNKYIASFGRDRRVYENTNGFVLGHLSSNESTFCQNVDEQRDYAHSSRNNSAAKAASYVDSFDRVNESTNEYVPGPPSDEQSLFNQNVDDQWANARWYREKNAEKAASYVENYDRIHENANEYMFAPSASNEHSTCYQSIDEQLANAGWYRPKNVEKSGSYVENLDMHCHSPHNEMEQFTPLNCGMSFFETALSRITEAANFDASPSKFQNGTTIARALPSDHELTSHCGHSLYHQVDHESSLVQKNNSHRFGEHNLDALPKDIAFHEKAGGSTGYSDFSFVNHMQRSHLHLQSGIHESPLNSDFPKNIGLDAYRVPPASRPYLDFPSASPGEAALQGGKLGSPHLPFYSCSKPSNALNSTVQSLAIKDCIAMQESEGLLYSGVVSEKNVIDDGTHRNISSEISDSGYKKCMRKSVFSRLSSNKCPLKEKESDCVTSHDRYVMDTSVDDVMDMLQNLVKRKMRCKPSVTCHDDNVVTIHEKHDVAEPDHNPSMMTSLKKTDKRYVHQSMKQKVVPDSPAETRAVDFKRRSDITKRLHVSDSCIVKELPVQPPKHRTLKEKMPSENEVDKEPACKIAKRRLLARPLFGKAADTLDEADHRSVFHKTSNDVNKEPASKVAKRRKLMRPLFGKAGGTSFDESDHQSVFHKTSNDDPKFVIEKQHSTNDLPLSGPEKSSDFPTDISYRDGDGNITSLDNVSPNVLLPAVHENNDSNVKQSLDCEINRTEMHGISVMGLDIKNPVQCSETAPLVASQCSIRTSGF